MHNLSSKDCKRVLEQTKRARGSDSKILVDEIVLPARDAHWRAVQLDLFMMAALGAIERTEEQWHELLGSIGLKMDSKYVYDAVQGDTVFEVVPS